MNFNIYVEQAAEHIVVSLRGRFNHEAHAEFRGVVEQLQEQAGQPCVVDLSFVQEMDSSALGLLLLLRDRMGGKSANIRISGAGESTRKILQIANFHRYFSID